MRAKTKRNNSEYNHDRAADAALWQWRWIVLAVLMAAIAVTGNAGCRCRRATYALPRRQMEIVEGQKSGGEAAGMGGGISIIAVTMAVCLLCFGVSRRVRCVANGRGGGDEGGGDKAIEPKEQDGFEAALRELLAPLTHIITPLKSLSRENMAEHDRHKVDLVVRNATKMRELIEKLVADVTDGAYDADLKAGQTEPAEPAVELNSRCYLAEWGDDESLKERMSKHDREFVESLNRLVDANMGNHGFSVNSVTEALSVSRSLLHRKMKATLGLPIGDYIRRRRLVRACELLRQGYNVSETAYRTGFADPSYFSKTFKRMLGITPREWLDTQKD